MKITRNTTTKLSQEEIVDIIKEYYEGKEYKRLCAYRNYYDVKNEEIYDRWNDKRLRRKKPNNLVPTSYYPTVVDSMAGYMFQNVQYQPKSDMDIEFTDNLNEILTDNNVDIKDMIVGIRALALNKAIELVYTEGTENNIKIRYATIDPQNMILIWDDTIEPEIYAAIWCRDADSKDYDKKVDVIYADEWQYYNKKGDKLIEREDPRPLIFKENPVCLYNTDILTYKSPFDKIIPYVNALDVIVTGNSNEIDRLVDALLVLGKSVKQEDLEHMEEWKVLQDMKKEDRAEYLTKEMSPVFREYVTKLLIQEIHKHSHVIDWYSPDTGLSGNVSSKALRTRLFDMDMFSRRIEKVFKEGSEKRIRLISYLMSVKGMGAGDVKVVYNRTVPNDIEDKVNAMKGVDFLTKQTKVEICGLDWNVEQERIEDEQGEVEEMEVGFEQDNNQADEEANQDIE